MTPFEWEKLKNYKKGEFVYPDLINKNFLRKLDRATTVIKNYWMDKHKQKLSFNIISDCDPTGLAHVKKKTENLPKGQWSRHYDPYYDAVDLYIKINDTFVILPADEQFILISQFSFGGVGFYPFNKHTPGLHIDDRPWEKYKRSTWWRDSKGNYKEVYDYFENRLDYKSI